MTHLGVAINLKPRWTSEAASSLFSSMDFLFQVLFSLRETFKAGIIVTPELKQKENILKLKITKNGLILDNNDLVKYVLNYAH